MVAYVTQAGHAGVERVQHCRAHLEQEIVAQLAREVAELANELAIAAPLSLTAAKLTIHEALRRDAAADLALCERLADDVYASHDYIEGRAAFAAKRPPRFEGR